MNTSSPIDNCIGQDCTICYPHLKYFPIDVMPAHRTLTPHKCPICEGRGTVPCNFYDRSATVSNASPVHCRSCIQGIIYT